MNNCSAIILAAGKGTRLEPLTKTIPKPLIKVAGKPILEHNMLSLLPYVDEFIVVVGYMSELIKEEFGDSFQGKPIKYVVQEQQLGTGHAVKMCREYLSTDYFFVIYGDDIYDPEIFASIAKYGEVSIVGKIVENWKPFGIFQKHSDGTLMKLVEKPKTFIGNEANIGVYFLRKDIFNYYTGVKLSIRGEYEFTDVVTNFAAAVPLKVIPTEGYWLTIGYPWNILAANEVLLQNIEPKNEGAVEEFVVMKGTVSIGKGTVIQSGTYINGNVIIGENCIIGPHTYIRGNVVIGDDCKIGSSVEIEHCSIGNKVNIEHLSFVGYSVLGNNIILGGGTVTADRRHDRKPIRVNVKEELVDTHMHHLGAIIGDHVRTGINTSIYPGRKLHYHSYTIPGEVVKQDKLSSHEIELK